MLNIKIPHMKEIWDTKKGGTENIINKMTEENFLPQSREKGVYHGDKKHSELWKDWTRKEIPHDK